MGNKPKKTVDEEQAEALYGGIQPEQLEASLVRLAELNEEKASVLGDIAAVHNAFEKLGGHKLAFALTQKLERMTEDKRNDFVQAFISYANARGLFPQADLFATMPGHEPAAGADPQMANETAH